MKITIRVFASLRETVGTGQLELDLPENASLLAVVEQLLARYPELDGEQEMWHFAVNQTHANPDTLLRAGDRVAIFPYIAGG
jgi:molybdopterin synthase sulfur carrier subunit